MESLKQVGDSNPRPGKVSTITELEGLIRYWESVQKQFSYLLEPSVLFNIKNTIKYLKQIQNKER